MKVYLDSQTEYENLANAVVEQAADDYRAWKRFRHQHPLKKSEKVNWGEDAERFFKSKDLIAFTELDGNKLLKMLDEQLVKQCRELDLKQMHKQWKQLQGFTEKKKGKKKK